jgi:hypothetical protein
MTRNCWDFCFRKTSTNQKETKICTKKPTKSLKPKVQTIPCYPAAQRSFKQKNPNDFLLSCSQKSKNPNPANIYNWQKQQTSGRRYPTNPTRPQSRTFYSRLTAARSAFCWSNVLWHSPPPIGLFVVLFVGSEGMDADGQR